MSAVRPFSWAHVGKKARDDVSRHRVVIDREYARACLRVPDSVTRVNAPLLLLLYFCYCCCCCSIADGESGYNYDRRTGLSFVCSLWPIRVRPLRPKTFLRCLLLKHDVREYFDYALGHWFISNRYIFSSGTLSEVNAIFIRIRIDLDDVYNCPLGCNYTNLCRWHKYFTISTYAHSVQDSTWIFSSNSAIRKKFALLISFL